MTLEEFAEMTRCAIARDDFENYLPTACYPARHHLKVLEGLPPEIEPEKAVLEWAAKSANENEEFLVAFRIDDEQFKVIRRIGSYSEDEIFAI